MSNELLDAKEAAAQFHSRFQKEREDIHSDLVRITADNGQLDASFDAIHRRINELSKTVTNATIYLPAYDQRQCQQQTKSLLEKLTVQRTALVPKSKFSFKSKRTQPATVVPTTTQPPLAETIEPQNTPTSDSPATFSFVRQSNSYMSISCLLSDENKPDGQEKMNDCVVSDLENCIVNLVHSDVKISAIHVNNLKNCLVITGPISGSILLRKCVGCVFLLACHQFRMHESCDVDVYLHATSRPIIEDSHRIRFGPYDTRICAEIQQACQTTHLDLENNQYASVEDFNWLKQQSSPNWSVLKDHDRVPLDWARVMELEQKSGKIDESVLETLLCRNQILE